MTTEFGTNIWRKVLRGATPRVFVSHGHDHEALRLVTDFVKGLDAHPVVFGQSDETEIGETVIANLEALTGKCHLAIVLMTADDRSEHGWAPRPNVVHELGFLQARLGRKNVQLLQDSRVKLPSNLGGVWCHEYHESVEETFPRLERALRVPIRRIRAGKPRTPTQPLVHSAWLPLAVVLLGNLALQIGAANHFVERVTEIDVFVLLQLAGYLVLAVMLLGYAALMLRLPFLSQIASPWIRRPLGVAAALPVVLLNTLILPGPPDRVEYYASSVQEEFLSSWVNEIWRRQSKSPGRHGRSGGFFGSPKRQLTQAYGTAQALTAILTAAHVRPDGWQHVGRNTWRNTEQAFAYVHRCNSTSQDPNEPYGWAYYAPMDYAGAIDERHGDKATLSEIAAWVIVAQNALLATVPRETGHDTWLDAEEQRLRQNVGHLLERQFPTDGGWSPLRLGGELDPKNVRTYATTMAVWALAETLLNAERRALTEARREELRRAMSHGVAWLLAQEVGEGGWGWSTSPGRGATAQDHFPGLTAQTLYALTRALEVQRTTGLDVFSADQRGLCARRARDFVSYLEGLKLKLFIKSIYTNERTPDGENTLVGATLEGTTFLWFPWTSVVLATLARDELLAERWRRRAGAQLRNVLSQRRITELFQGLKTQHTYVLAENVFCAARLVVIAGEAKE